MEKKQKIKKVKLAEVLSALDALIAVAAIFITKDLDPYVIAQLHFSEDHKDEESLDDLKNDKSITYFFGAEDCPVKEEEVELLIVERLYIVRSL